ncbi:tobamovirus multiplication protein 2A [Ziziphus jujuba]|uniref:Tobamovirus multiplication protein 2A n=1 Tax=Ziziphus jujuba TaxID=326968 RepID=A0A9B4EJ58_ZIZJJ|nr:tobamovirus multiplication protein 2A [Ziziphus jujuba]XP_015896815.2 tobamovirus multiplication protein 2A [Ziziphus jujuba]
MACRGCLECILKLLNFLLTLLGLAMVAYGIYLLVEYNKVSGDTLTASSVDKDNGLIQLGRPILMAVSLSASSIFDNLPKAWFIYLFIGIGVILFVISCFGCIGTVTRNGCCLSCYSVLVVLLILVEVGCAAFIFFDKSWQSEIPTDKTGDFDMIYAFLKEHWNIVRWVVLGAVILEALLFVIALMVRAANKPPEYDSDDEFIAPRQQIRQPLINRPAVPATGVPVAGTLDQRPSRNDAWSTRMREKYGLDTSEFTYNPNESHRFQQVGTQPAEERRRCTIM